MRTGQTFGLSSARYSSSGEAIEDAPLLSRLCVGALQATYAVPISDGLGGAFVVWIESAAEDCDLRIQRVDAAGGPAANWPDGGRMLCTARGTQSQPTLALAGDAGLWVAWKDFRDPQHSAIYLSRLDASGVPAAHYPEDGIRVSGADTSASDPALVADAAGGAWLLWQQGRSGARGLWLKHFGIDGALAPGWPSEGRTLTTTSEDVTHPIASADGAGGFVLAWVSGGAGSARLRVTRFEASGSLAIGWPADGLEAGSTTALLLPAAITADSAGIYLAWAEHFEDSTAARLTRTTPSGALAPGWSAGGRRLGDTGVASSPAIVGDGTGGAYLTWVGQSSDSGDLGVLLSRLSASGSVASGWPTPDVTVPNTGPNTYRPRLLALDDGVLVSWSDGGGKAEGVILNAAMASLGALPQLDKVETWPDLVRLSWRAAGEVNYTTFVERQGEDGTWVPLRQLARDAKGALTLEDREVTAGEALGYRLRLRSPQMELVTGEVSFVVPVSAPLAIKGLAVQGGRLFMVGSVPSRGESRFELFDVQGRRLLRDVRQHDHAGEVKLDWPVPAGVRAGVFFARFTLGRETKTRQFVVGR